VNSVQMVSQAQAQVQAAASAHEVLAAAFDAFEVIRMHARASEDRAPGLFAAFVATASAAVDGREAVTLAPSLPPGRSSVTAVTPATARTAIGEVTAALAALAASLRERLTLIAIQAPEAGDRAACAEAAQAAGRIVSFMTGDGDGRLW
jgi:hypothetical protein